MRGIGPMRAIKVLTLVLALAAAACGGGDTTDTTTDTTVGAEPTTTEGETTTTAAEATTTTSEDDRGTVSFDDMPTECVDALVGFLQAIEPALEGVDFDTLTASDMEALGTEMEALGEEYGENLEELDCPEPEGSDEESFAAMIEIAEREAPGTVGYLEWVQSFATAADSMGDASGDCETDIAAFELIVEENESMSTLTMEEIVEVGGLVTSISTVCSPERSQEFLSQDNVANFLED
jgi:hypothetical protein